MKEYVDKTQLQQCFELVYPVGSIYISCNNTNPALLFGFGTWSLIKDAFLVGAGNKYDLNSTGGEETHKLTTAEMPSHKHIIGNEIYGNKDIEGLEQNYGVAFLTSNDPLGLKQGVGKSTNERPFVYANNDKIYHQHSMENTGGNVAHNNLPPYLAVNIWRRDN